MASSQSAPRKYFARDVAAYNNTELDQYLEEHCVDGRAIVVDVEDPENLPESFIQRLRDRAQRGSPGQSSRPVDPGQLTSRLLDISSGRDASPRPLPTPFDHESSASSTPSLPPDHTQNEERERYNYLVREGGRPLYSIDLVDEVARDPSSHRDMLRPWVDFPDDWCVFNEQMSSWWAFRQEWQKFNRGDFTGWDKSWGWDYTRFKRAFRRKSPTYTEAVKKLLTVHGFTRPFQFHDDPTQQDKLTEWIEYLGYECWRYEWLLRRIKSLQPGYDAAWKTLVDSNVLRPLETEEYVCSDECAIRNQSERDQATRAVALARSDAKAVVKSVYRDAHNPKGPHLTSAARMQRMMAAKSRIEAAEAALASIKRRSDLITKFNQAVGTYLTTKKRAERHSIRVQWILEQVPLVEAELNGPGVAETSPDAVCGTKRRLGCDNDEEDEATHGRMVKKQRQDAGEPGPTPGRNDGPGYQGAKPKRSRDGAADDGPPSKRLKRGGDHLGSHNKTSDRAVSAGDSQELGTTEVGRPERDECLMRTIESPNSKRSKPSSDHLQPRKSTGNIPRFSTTTQRLRRSARIAACQEALHTVVTPPGAAKNPPRSSRRRMTQAPAPPSPTGPQDQRSRLPATKTRNQGAGGGSRRDTSRAQGIWQGRLRSRRPGD